VETSRGCSGCSPRWFTRDQGFEEREPIGKVETKENFFAAAWSNHEEAEEQNKHEEAEEQ
jgi:hypothetical protein